jgi:predicted nuclease with TOPRIM domain
VTTPPFEEKLSEIFKIKDKIEQEIQKNVYLREANHILYEKNTELEKKINELQEKIDSLEQRVSLLIEFQAKFMTGNRQ